MDCGFTNGPGIDGSYVLLMCFLVSLFPVCCRSLFIFLASPLVLVRFHSTDGLWNYSFWFHAGGNCVCHTAAGNNTAIYPSLQLPHTLTDSLRFSSHSQTMKLNSWDCTNKCYIWFRSSPSNRFPFLEFFYFFFAKSKHFSLKINSSCCECGGDSVCFISCLSSRQQTNLFTHHTIVHLAEFIHLYISKRTESCMGRLSIWHCNKVVRSGLTPRPCPVFTQRWG